MLSCHRQITHRQWLESSNLLASLSCALLWRWQCWTPNLTKTDTSVKDPDCQGCQSLHRATAGCRCVLQAGSWTLLLQQAALSWQAPISGSGLLLVSV